MADAILYGVARTIIVSLGSSTLQQVGSIWGFEDDLEKMSNTVSTIQAVLGDAEEQQGSNHQVKNWLMKLREAVFDADDLLSEFSTHVLRQNVMGGGKMTKKVRVFFSSSNQLAFGFKMARKIKAMRERLNDIAKDRNNFQLVERPLGTAVVTRKRDQTHSFVREEDVIGREEDRKAIIGQLLDFDVEENVSFISIVGIGGLGKTTLVQYIYNDEKVKAYFELQMWVCVSNDFDVKTIVERIITSATGKKPENLDMDQLQIELRDKLSQKKYLLVLDDVWNEDKEIWCNLKTLLLDGSKGSKVVITTRSNLVADITGTMQYFLKGLSKDQSWSLLKQMAFEKKQDTINPNFEAIGRDIVEKCCGVPLAIKAIGRVLYNKRTESEWSYIKDKELKNVIKLKDDIFPVLKLSYDHLPPHLKCCFAYCSLFPKDYLIEKLTLIRLWIAQGFIQSQEENLQLEDIANEYFEDLLWRSFFQVVEEDNGMFMNFKMHDLIHDLAQSISSIECTLVNSNAKHVNEKVRHMSFPFYNDSFFGENLNSLVKANKIRTFILTSHKWNDPVEVDESTLRKLISAFGYIRALDLHGLKIKTLPNIIGKLMHLKYLDLSKNDIEVLPGSITRLVNLHTLKLQYCEKLKELPIDIQKLVSLKHLDIKSCYNLTHMPYGVGQLTSLQTLSLFVVSKDPIGSSKRCGGLAELNKLNDLRGEIEITDLELVKDAISETKAANLKEKQHLSDLSLRWNSRLDDVINAGDDENLLDGLQPPQNLKYLFVLLYGGVRFSIWLSSLTKLTELYIHCCNKCQHLPPLYQLPSLRKISLWEMQSLEYISDLDITNEVSASSLTTFFPSLESLTLVACPNLKGWWKRDIVDNGDATIMTSTSSSWSHQYHQHMSLPSFPCLSDLNITYCSKLTSMPPFPYLEKLLDLIGVSGKALQQTMAMKMNTAGASSLSSSIPPLSKLRKLRLSEMLDKEPLPEEWLQNLTSLEELNILRCSTSLSQILRHLTSLKELSIVDCEEVDLFSDADDDGTKFQHVKCLQSLSFSNISKLESLPAYLQSVTTLQKLSIYNCPSLMTLPEWIGNLTSLQYLEIEVCPNLTSLPEGMHRLTSLQFLRINNCPHLKQRCQKEIGEDWTKIAHVPKYSIW
ncbi:putative disease resistance protein RGA4 [Quercus lobata]|uniref:CC-NBS-LRR protein n=1 Tax=Quercus lobata TaxID=97700 RepID=A0A7N2MW48_QUELO|nr:putative disease resistance protein RGA4 [Quercus lobata]XP_030943168.1 putative disease resistance protein RGA4 [Quercus lobata]XP_030943169.1 putative disease resistance protein RGA4 [Quercus lobata]XP_030943170.1 putative disease resistance protein RGA4 [Quercus lobata]XP_030943171.1 putative disease resistance protein RGA4 [Quercus lobata]XP_030943172.1 putative disease resistance protein RGA4 [Quercus lobata]XP_030943173.1 putative disease resistance protein RGA4 [Quercus lobata]XP_0